MSIKALKTQAKKLIPLLEQEHDDIEELALELLTLSYELYESRAKYAVVMQPHTLDGRTMSRAEARGTSVVLDVYSTEKAAASDAGSACMRRVGGGDLATTWVVPIKFTTGQAVWKELRESFEPDDAPPTPAEKLVAILQANPHVRYCEEIFRSPDGHIQQCILEHQHPGPHEGHVPERDTPFNQPRRLSGLPVDLEGDSDGRIDD